MHEDEVSMRIRQLEQVIKTLELKAADLEMEVAALRAETNRLVPLEDPLK